jgi:UDP-galactopyranose mutase
MKKALIIGGGFAGCSAAHLLELQGGWDVTLVERAPFLGAGVRTQWFGGHPYTFGPRHFLTQNESVYEYLNRYCPLRRCSEHIFLSYIEADGQFYNYPIHIDDVARMPDRDTINAELADAQANPRAGDAKNLEDFWIASVGKTLYSKFIEKYSKKMWQVDDNRKIDDFAWSPKGVALKRGPREAWDTAISAYPHAADGYNRYFEIATQAATVLLGTTIQRYDLPARKVVIDGTEHRYDVIINTISPDIVMNKVYGELPYLGRDFHKIVLPVAHAFPPQVYFLYYCNDEQFTRIVEYKQFTRQQWDAPTTLLGMEIPSRNGKYYPLPFKSEIEKAQRYIRDMPDGVFSIGRAGTYQYGYDIDNCIESAMDVVARLRPSIPRTAA